MVARPSSRKSTNDTSKVRVSANMKTNNRGGIARIIKANKWTQEQVLREARKRTKELFTDNSKKIQTMLANLMVEAGWSEEEFIDALCQDVITKGRD